MNDISMRLANERNLASYHSRRIYQREYPISDCDLSLSLEDGAPVVVVVVVLSMISSL